MGARRISNATNEKIIALMSMGKTGEQAAFAVGVSGSYCNKLYTVVKHIANEQWDELIEYSRYATTGGVITWACEYLDTQLPQEVAETIEAVRYIAVQRPKRQKRHRGPSRQQSRLTTRRRQLSNCLKNSTRR